MKTCQQCGTKNEDKNKFCCNCAASLIAAEADSSIIEINGQTVNLDEIIKIYGSDRISSIKYLHDLAKIKWAEAKEIMNTAYDKNILPDSDTSNSADKQRLSKEWEKIEQHYSNSANFDPVPHCPRCGSTSITVIKKGFGLGKAAVGGFVAGPVGLLAGAAGANKIKRVCINCGHKF